jgi:hypothetical protein
VAYSRFNSVTIVPSARNIKIQISSLSLFEDFSRARVRDNEDSSFWPAEATLSGALSRSKPSVSLAPSQPQPLALPASPLPTLPWHSPRDLG